jgi:hypothetical protein
MQKELLAKEINDLMEVIREQQSMVLSHNNRIPQIELDILMGNVRKLYECLIQLNRINSETAAPSIPPVPHQSPDMLIARVPDGEKPVEAPEVVAPQITSPPPVPVSRPEPLVTEPEPAGPVISQERTQTFTKPQTKAARPASLFDEPVTVAEKFGGSPSLYDKISAGSEDKSLAGRMQKNPVSDLKKSIGINEKFSFINDLFDGDLNAYNEAIEKLNSSTDHQSAMQLLNNELAAPRGWTDEGESFQKLKNLLDRRFSA